MYSRAARSAITGGTCSPPARDRRGSAVGLLNSGCTPHLPLEAAPLSILKPLAEFVLDRDPLVPLPNSAVEPLR
jgi:hypothetical protein